MKKTLKAKGSSPSERIQHPTTLTTLSPKYFALFNKLFLECLTKYASCLQPLFKYLIFYPAVDCGPLTVPTNGSSFGNKTVFPNSVLFNCDPGFILSGSSKRGCQPNGTWSGFATMCTGRFEMYLVSQTDYRLFKVYGSPALQITWQLP